MKRDHLSLATGFLPGISVLIFFVCRRYLQSGQSLPGWADHISAGWLWVIAEALAVLLPLLILLLLTGKNKERKMDFGFRGFSATAIPMLLNLSIAIALAELLIGDVIAGLFGKTYAEAHLFLPLLESDASMVAVLMAVVLIPGILGQIFFGQGLMTVYARCGGLPAIVVCALAYSFLLSTPELLAGAFLCMLAVIYVSWAMNSVWVGVLTQGIYRVVHLLLLFVAHAYSGQELWSVVRLGMIFLMGLFLYLSMHSMEQLMETGKLRRLERLRKEKLMSEIIVSPGLWMTIFLFVIHWVT